MTQPTPSQSTSSAFAYTWHNQNLVEATQGIWHYPSTLSSQRICTDTRHIQQGDIFLALRGDNFDGHNYINTAKQAGAVAVIVETACHLNIPQLVVNNTRLALGNLGAYRRSAHQGVNVIAITGSSGKTTCKEMLGSILTSQAPTLVTRGNLNNDLGVPMMLLELLDTHTYAVLELGANHMGEIAYTSRLVNPQVACILNIGTAHLGEFGGRDAICHAKAEIYQGLAKQGVAIYPEADNYSEQLQQAALKHTNNLLGFGVGQVYASDININAENCQFILHIHNKQHTVNLPFAGQHNISNALAAAACAHALGISIQAIAHGLTTAKPAKGRLNTQTFGIHKLIDDTYNANPNSVKAAAQVLASQHGNKVLVLGDIGELGDASQCEHYQLGKFLATVGVNKVLSVGEFAGDIAKGIQDASNSLNPDQAITTVPTVQTFESKAEALTALQNILTTNTPHNILFKGSRFMQMETLIEQLLETA